MRILSALLSLLLSPALLHPSKPFPQDDDGRANIVVDDDKVQCPNASFTSIQAAVNAANPGDMIRVCPGTYAEQVVIDKALTIEADNGAIIMPRNVTANATGVASGEPLAAVILVKNAENVKIKGFILDGTNNGITECTPRLIGILYQDASGSVRHNAIRHMSLAPSLNGCQSGDGVVVQSSSGQASKVTIADNSVHDYQKNGITGNEVGTAVVIQQNTVTGIGPTSGAAQNGIQVGFGATGSVTGNSVTDNVWSPCVSVQQCQFNATGILVFQSNGVEVNHNEVGTNQVGIFIGGQNSTVERNRVFNSQVLVGIELAGDNNEASHNQIIHSDQAALLIQGNNNQVAENKITEAGIGILKISGSTGNVISGNLFFATPIPVQDPSPQTSAQVSPVR